MNTNKIDLIKAEVVRLQNELIQEKKKGFGSDADDACILELQNVLTYIDSLQEEPVSEELEGESKKYSSCIYLEEVLSDDDKEVLKTRLMNTFKAGAKWQEKQDQSTIELAEDHAMFAGMEKMKEKMMVKAVDVEVKVDAGGYPYIPQMELYDYDNDVALAKEGDKYKVVLIKEE